MKIFAWTCANIRKVPDGFPIIDDHVWYIIIRGYGMSDQSSDVFATLCNYAGVDAFYTIIRTKDKASEIILSFVRLDKRWRFFDPYRKVYFRNNNGDLATVDDIKNGNWKIVRIGEIKNFDYGVFFENLPVIKKIGLERSNMQAPLRHLIFEVKKINRVKNSCK